MQRSGRGFSKRLHACLFNGWFLEGLLLRLIELLIHKILRTPWTSPSGCLRRAGLSHHAHGEPQLGSPSKLLRLEGRLLDFRFCSADTDSIQVLRQPIAGNWQAGGRGNSAHDFTTSSLRTPSSRPRQHGSTRHEKGEKDMPLSNEATAATGAASFKEALCDVLCASQGS